MATILLTDGQQRKTLSAARTLGKAGHRVLVAEVTRFATARFSRYVAKGLVCPDAGRDPEAFSSWLCRAVEREGIDAVLPMDDDTTQIVVHRQKALPAATLVPTPEQFDTARDKGETVALARRAGVRAPHTLRPTVAEWADPMGLAALIEAQLGRWPLVVKARNGSGARGIRRVEHFAGLVEAYGEISRQDATPLIQEYIPPGRKFDVCLLFANTGELMASFVQEELRGYPIWSGPSSLQESVNRPDLIAFTLRLLAPIGWRGPVEVEWMEDPSTGEPVLMEINPRFWASVDLAVGCGVDFPRWTAESALGTRPTGSLDYPVGKRCRWLLPGDLLHFIANPRRRAMNPPFFRTMDGRTHDDILSWNDPLPTVGFFLACIRYALDVRMWRMILR